MSKHILIPILKAIEYINKNIYSNDFKLKIYGVIKRDMVQSNWYDEYTSFMKD